MEEGLYDQHSQAVHLASSSAGDSHHGGRLGYLVLLGPGGRNDEAGTVTRIKRKEKGLACYARRALKHYKNFVNMESGML